MPEVSIIIVSYNVKEYLLKCLASVYGHTKGVTFEIIVVDNNSTDRSVAALKEKFPAVRVIENRENTGFARANNQGAAIAEGEFLLLLNPDTEFKNDAVSAVHEFMVQITDAGMSSCRLYNTDGTIQRSIYAFPSVSRNILNALFIDRIICPEFRNSTYLSKKPLRIPYCTGAFMMVKKAALGSQMLLNEDFFMYSEEKDLALRLKRCGFKTYFVPAGEVIHHGGKSTDLMPAGMFAQLQKSQVIFYRTHYSAFYAWLLILSWGLVLATNLIVSVPLCAVGRISRLKLFISAIGALLVASLQMQKNSIGLFSGHRVTE